jgi:hypothetical protein
VTYRFEVANDAGFSSIAASGATTRSGGSTTTVNLGDLAEAKTFYWRAYGTNGKVTSAYSAVATFKTPATPAPSPGGSGCNNPGTPASWTDTQWHDCFFSLVALRGVGPYVTSSALYTLRPDLNARGADWQYDGAGNLRPRIYLPTGNPNDPWGRPVDVGDWNGPWKWIPR